MSKFQERKKFEDQPLAQEFRFTYKVLKMSIDIYLLERTKKTIQKWMKVCYLTIRSMMVQFKTLPKRGAVLIFLTIPSKIRTDLIEISQNS